MKQGWEIKKLGEVFTLKAGKSISSDNIKPDGGEKMYPCFGGNGIRGYVDTYIAEGAYPIIGRVGALCGNIQLSQGKFYATEHAIVAYIKSNDIKAEWAALALKSLNLRQYAKGVAQPVISAGQLSELSIAVPPIEVQERIVEELDCLSGIIEKKREQLKELDALAESIFYTMFGDPITNEKGWEVKTIKEVAPQQEYKGDVPCINGKYWLLNLDMVSPQTGEVIEQCMFEYEEIGNSTIKFSSDNVLYSKLRPYLNKVVVPNEIGYATSELVPLCPKKDVLHRVFFASLLRSSHFVKYISGKVAGAKMPRVAMSEFREFAVMLPPLTLQQKFADKIEAIEKQKELIKQSITETEELFNSRMDYYFN